MTTSSARQMRATTLVTDASTLARPRASVSDSRLNHATRMPASITAWAMASVKWLLPVPLGPQMARFSARPTHSKVRRACWVGRGMDERAGSKESKVLPLGSPARCRRSSRVARSRPATSSASSTLSISAGSQRWARAVAQTSGAA